jgi:hypothetical protein
VEVRDHEVGAVLARPAGVAHDLFARDEVDGPALRDAHTVRPIGVREESDAKAAHAQDQRRSRLAPRAKRSGVADTRVVKREPGRLDPVLALVDRVI